MSSLRSLCQGTWRGTRGTSSGPLVESLEKIWGAPAARTAEDYLPPCAQTLSHLFAPGWPQPWQCRLSAPPDRGDTMQQGIPTEEDILQYFTKLSNWGRWGTDDQL